MSDTLTATDVIRDPDSKASAFRKAVEYWLRLDRDSDPVEELELQSIATGRLLELKANMLRTVEELDAAWDDLRRRLAIESEHRRQRYDEQCDVAYLASLDRVEAFHREAGGKMPAQTRLALEAKADALYLAEKEALRMTVLAEATSKDAQAAQDALRQARYNLARLNALLARVEGRYWTLQQLAKDRRMELRLSGDGRYA